MKPVTLSTHSSFSADPTSLNNRGYMLSLARVSVNIVR
jgi:fluoride ion exporter CrcB/FEX